MTMSSIKFDKDGAAAFARAVQQAQRARSGKKRGVRYPAQRDAFRLAGTKPAQLQAWLGCSYLRARDLRSGMTCLRADELARIAADAPATALVVSQALAPDAGKQRALFGAEGELRECAELEARRAR